MGSKNLLVWNVRGLNTRSHRDAVRQLVIEGRPSLVCLQETKLHVMTDFDIVQILGESFDYAYLLVDDTRGGILVAWLPSVWSFSNILCQNRSISRKLRQLSSVAIWSLSVVHGPARDAEKVAFLQELHELSLVYVGLWLVADNFNLICGAQDRSNDLKSCTLRAGFSPRAMKGFTLRWSASIGLSTW
jgi:exonuclease III